MPDYIILFRNTRNGVVGHVDGGTSDTILVFPTLEAAEEAVPTVPILRAYPYQIVELEI